MSEKWFNKYGFLTNVTYTAKPKGGILMGGNAQSELIKKHLIKKSPKHNKTQGLSVEPRNL